MTKIDFDIMGDCLVNHEVDHDVLVAKPKKKLETKIKEPLEEKDIPETQKQIVEV